MKFKEMGQDLLRELANHRQYRLRASRSLSAGAADLVSR